MLDIKKLKYQPHFDLLTSKKILFRHFKYAYWSIHNH